MRFGILGSLEVLDDGRPVALGGDKQRALLAVFLVNANRRLSAERLIDDLWGESPPPTAAKSLQVHISRLRKALAQPAGDGGDGVVVTRERGYELRVNPESVDALRFVRLLGDARAELAAGRFARAVPLFEQALALWRGQPLAEFAYERFAEVEIARLEELRVLALEELIEAKLALGRHAEVVGDLESLIVEHPYRERLRSQLMLALYRSDRQAEALQAYQDARRELVEELGIEPSERLRELERAILAQDPALAFTDKGESPALPVVDADPGAFVGRERELGELTASLENALAAHGRLLLLSGEPGIGKSRLAEELIARAEERGALVLVGRCWEAGGAPAYWPWVQSLRAYVRASETAALRAELGSGAADLAQLIPELGERFPGLPDPPRLDPEGARFRLFDAVTQFLGKASRRRPLMITLDDLHAADEPSLLLLRFLARELGSMRVLILGAFRDVDPVAGQPLAETIREVSREPVTGRLMLTGLSEQQVGQYVDVAASGLAPSSSLKATLYSQTEGNPLFVGETVRLLAIEGAAELEANAVLAIPQSVRGVIARRLEHLSPACRHLLELAAVIGREFAIDALSPAAAGVEDSPLESLDEAIAARVVSEAPSDRGRLRFAHVLIRDTLYEGLGAVRRMRLHRHVGQTLEALYGDRPGPHLAELAHHYSQAEPAHTDKAIGYATGAGDRAARLLAFEEAARLYRLALGLGGSAMAGDKRCDLLLTLGDVEARAGNMDGAKQTFAEAAELARELGLGGRLARAALGYGGRFSFARAGTDERLMPLLEEGLAALGSTDAAMRARLLARLAGARRGETSREPRDSLAREALNLARGTGDRPTLGFVLEAVYMTLFDSATPEQRLAISAEMLSIAEQASDKERAVLARMYRFVVFIRIGELAAAQRELGRMNFVATQLGQPAQRAFALVGRAMLALLTGSLAEAESLIHQVLRLGEHAEAWAVAYHRLQLWALRREQGRLAEVEQTVQRSISEHPNYPIWRCVLTHLHVAIGNVDEARDELETLAAGDKFAGLPDDEEWNLGVSLLSEVAVALGDLPRVQILYELLSPYSDLLIYGAPEVSTGATSRYLGKLAVGLGRWEDAERHFSHALELNAKVRARPWLARTQLDYARMLRVRGIPSDQARADELLRSAVSTFRSLGMTSHADSASTSEPSASELVL